MNVNAPWSGKDKSLFLLCLERLVAAAARDVGQNQPDQNFFGTLGGERDLYWRRAVKNYSLALYQCTNSGKFANSTRRIKKLCTGYLGSFHNVVIEVGQQLQRNIATLLDEVGDDILSDNLLQNPNFPPVYSAFDGPQMNHERFQLLLTMYYLLQNPTRARLDSIIEAADESFREFAVANANQAVAAAPRNNQIAPAVAVQPAAAAAAAAPAPEEDEEVEVDGTNGGENEAKDQEDEDEEVEADVDGDAFDDDAGGDPFGLVNEGKGDEPVGRGEELEYRNIEQGSSDREINNGPEGEAVHLKEAADYWKEAAQRLKKERHVSN